MGKINFFQFLKMMEELKFKKELIQLLKDAAINIENLSLEYEQKETDSYILVLKIRCKLNDPKCNLNMLEITYKFNIPNTRLIKKFSIDDYSFSFTSYPELSC